MNKYIFILTFLVWVPILSSAQWVSDPMANTAIALSAGEQAIPKIATCSDGTTYTTWFSNESGNYNVRLQKMDLFGNKLWGDDGLLVSDNPSMTWLTDWDMTVDQQNCAILTFQDIRNTDNDVFAYRVSPDGEFLWGEDGIELSTGPAFDAAPKVKVTNSGNAVLAWQADDVVILQKISPDGTKQWGDGGITLSSTNTYSWPQLLPVGTDDVLLKYFEDSGPVWAPTRHVFVQRFDSMGLPVWSSPAVVSDAGGISAWTQIFPFINDGTDGFYMAWHDDRDNNALASVFVQHIDASGNVLFTDDGVEASTQPGRNNFYPFLSLIPGTNEVIVMWNEMDGDQNNRGLYGQKFSSTGSRLWSDNGKSFIELSSTNVYPFDIGTATEDFILFYETDITPADQAIMAMRIDASGDFVWAGEMIQLCGVPSGKVHAVANEFNTTQWIAVWEDSRNGNADIYGQNIQLDGTLGALPNQPQINITPDTLYIDENGLTYTINLHNPSFTDYILDTIYENAIWWDFDELPAFPYTIAPSDTLTLSITVVITGSGGMGTGYIYDTVSYISAIETKTSIVAFNLEVIPGINESKVIYLNVYPNPGSRFTFTLKESLKGGNLSVFNSIGHKILDIQVRPGIKSFSWEGKDDAGQKLPSGIYYFMYRTENDNLASGKIILE